MMIRRDRYKDVDAVVLENAILRVSLLPEYGGKIASIYHKPSGYETLYQNPAAEYRKTGYAASYLAGELSGFDDMFPTISECHYESDPWKGTVAPDHGELWSIPCECSTTDDEVHCILHGVRFPYQFEKVVRLKGETVEIRYAATNTSPHDLNFIWAAHPMFRGHVGMELEVPGGLASIVNSVADARLGAYGVRYDYPIAVLANDDRFDLRRVPARTGYSTQKYWFEEKNTEGWCALVHKEKHLRITLRVPPDEVPYLGVFVDEGLITGELILAPEPATAAMDRIDMSKAWGVSSTLLAKTTKHWHLFITVQDSRDPHSASGFQSSTGTETAPF